MTSKPDRYYKLWFDESDPLAMIAHDVDLKGVDRLFTYGIERQGEWPEGVRFVTDGEHAEDYLCAANGWILISERARSALESCAICEPQFLPVTVVRRDSGMPVGAYCVMHVPVAVEALDWEHTKWIDPAQGEGTDAIYNIAVEALCSPRIGRLDAFKLSVRQIVRPSVYVSERFRRCLKHEGASSGFRFKPIRVYGEETS